MRPVSNRGLRAFAIFSLVASSAVEFLQAVPAPFEFMHAVGEVVRNLGYAIFAAYIFNYMIVELPQRRRAAAAIRASISELEAVATNSSRYFTELMRQSGVQLSRDVQEDSELVELVRKHLSDEAGEVSPTPLDFALLEYLLSSIDKGFNLINPFLVAYPPDLAAEVTHFRQKFASVRQYQAADLTLLAFISPIRLGREFSQVLTRQVDDRSLRNLVEPYAVSYLLAERTETHFRYSEQRHHDGGQFASYLNPVGIARENLLRERQAQVRTNEADRATKSNTKNASESHQSPSGPNVVSTLHAATRKLLNAWRSSKGIWPD
jgi:hypothetical protein